MKKMSIRGLLARGMGASACTADARALQGFTLSKSVSLATTVAVALSLPMAAFSDTEISPQSITAVNVYSGTTAQGAWIKFAPAQPNVEGCPYAAGNLMWLDFTSATQPDGKVLYGTVLAGVVSGKKIVFSVRGCGNGGQIPLIYAVEIMP